MVGNLAQAENRHITATGTCWYETQDKLTSYNKARN